MQPKHSFLHILALLMTLPLFGTVAHATTIDIIQTIDFPGGTTTMPQKISDQTDLIGTTVDVSGKMKAFIYKVKILKFSPPLAPTFVGVSDTQGRGINSKRHSCGEYLNGTDGTFHGYLLYSGLMNTVNYVPYEVKRALDTVPLGINNFGDIAGSAVLSDGTQTGFISLGKVVTTFAVPNANATFAYQLNSFYQSIGYYIDSTGVAHGYTRDSDGTLTYPIDAPGATDTLLLGNNDSNWGVGRYRDASGVTHGLFYVTPDHILTYDYPGATYTSINGINKDGLICGHFSDAAGITHGFVARVNLTASGAPNTNTGVIPVKPAYVLPELSRIAVPAL
jgi:hypothetical protein